MELKHPALQYSENARVLIKYRTGVEANRYSKDEIMRNVVAPGYFIHHGGHLAVLLIDQDHDTLTKKNAVQTMITTVFKMPAMRGINEVLIAVIVHSSLWRASRLGTLVEAVAALNTNREKLVRLEIRGQLAFNALARNAVPVRADFEKNLGEAVLAPRLCTLRTGFMEAEERKKYARFFNDLSIIPPLEEIDALCIWNGYRAGDIIYTQNLSHGTVGAVGIYRVIPSMPIASTADEDE